MKKKKINTYLIFKISVLNKTLMSTLGKTYNSLGIEFLEDRQQNSSVILKVDGPSSHVVRPFEKLEIIGEPKVFTTM